MLPEGLSAVLSKVLVIHVVVVVSGKALNGRFPCKSVGFSRSSFYLAEWPNYLHLSGRGALDAVQ